MNAPTTDSCFGVTVLLVGELSSRKLVRRLEWQRSCEVSSALKHLLGICDGAAARIPFSMYRSASCDLCLVPGYILTLVWLKMWLGMFFSQLKAYKSRWLSVVGGSQILISTPNCVTDSKPRCWSQISIKIIGTRMRMRPPSFDFVVWIPCSGHLKGLVEPWSSAVSSFCGHPAKPTLVLLHVPTSSLLWPKPALRENAPFPTTQSLIDSLHQTTGWQQISCLLVFSQKQICWQGDALWGWCTGGSFFEGLISGLYKLCIWSCVLQLWAFACFWHHFVTETCQSDGTREQYSPLHSAVPCCWYRATVLLRVTYCLGTARGMKNMGINATEGRVRECHSETRCCTWDDVLMII